MVHGESWDFAPHSVRRACFSASQEEHVFLPAKRAIPEKSGSFLHPSCCTLGACLAKQGVLFTMYSPGSPLFPRLHDTEVSWLEQQGEPKNQISECALCTVVLLSSSAASASCKQAAQLMFDLPMVCSLVEPAQPQQHPWQTVLTPPGARMPSSGILATFPVGKHCPRNWNTSLPLDVGQKSELLRKMLTGGCGAPLTHGACGFCVHCHCSRICAGGFVPLSASCKAQRAAGLSSTPIAQLTPKLVTPCVPQ